MKGKEPETIVYMATNFMELFFFLAVASKNDDSLSSLSGVLDATNILVLTIAFLVSPTRQRLLQLSLLPRNDEGCLFLVYLGILIVFFFNF